jgi:M6 family metalloprotease-like protein
MDTLPISTSLDPMARGGWASIYVDYARIGLNPEDVRWEAKGNDGVSSVSVARPINPNLSAYEHRVICGFGEPEFFIFAINELDGSVIGSRRFRVLELWPDDDVGPPLVLTGVTSRPSPTWGGGPAGPQNIRSQPAPEDLRVAVVFVKTKGSNAVVNIPSRIKVFADNMVQSGDSVKTFYEEVSYSKTPAGSAPKDPHGSSVSLFSNKVYGPLDVDKSWSELFDPADKTDDFSSWNPKGATWSYLSNAFSAWLADNEPSTAITRQVDSVIFAVLPGTDAPDKTNPMAIVPAQWSWAWGNSASFYSKTASTFSQATLPAVIMPASQSMGLTTPWTDHDLFTIKCHELGHNLGMGDQYRFAEFSAEIDNRFLGTWDAMDNQYDGAHFSLPHRMRMGWINPDWIEAVDFSTNQSSRTVTLQAIESLSRSGPQSGAKAGIEIRIRDGRNYYFEYRRSQAGQIGDQNIRTPAAILGTDVDTVNASEINRPMILLLPNDIDGDGPVLATSGTDYEESDVTDIDRTHDFRIVREPINPANRNLQTVKIEYIGAHRAELRIRPAPGVNDFKSPDIEMDGPAGKNKVAKGLKNTISIRVHNVGSRAAKNVKLHVAWIPFTTAPGSWTKFVDPAPLDIAGKTSAVFTLEWTPPASIQLADKEVEHFCIRADIDRYVDPTDPAGNELNVGDNWAQSNFTTSAVGSASPSERRQTVLTATNVLKVSAIHETQLEQSSEHFRSYVEHAWQRLAPGETGVNGLWFESLAGDPVHDSAFQDAMHRSENRPILNNLSARAVIFPEKKRNNSVSRWGAQLVIQAGRKTWIDNLSANPEIVTGTVLGGSDTAPVTVRGGNVRLVAWRLDKPKDQLMEDSTVGNDGRFLIRIPRDLMHSSRPMRIVYQVFFHGSGRYVPCESKRSSFKSE